jgi:S-DNA-T family DNA segregation ATPase FtsK/SpoIIIE
MARQSGRKASSSPKSSRTSTKKSSSRSKNTAASQGIPDRELFREIGLMAFFAAMALLFLCNFGMIGSAGAGISGILFGIFGLTAYLAPAALFLAVAFWYANAGNPAAIRKLAAGSMLFLMAGVVCSLIAGDTAGLDGYDVKALFEYGSAGKKGGGVLAGSLTFLLQHAFGTVGTVLLAALCFAVGLILLTEKSLLKSVREKGAALGRLSQEERLRRAESAEIRRSGQEEARRRKEEEKRLREEERRLRAEEKENEKILRMEKKVSGVMLDTALSRAEEPKVREIHEIVLEDEPEDGRGNPDGVTEESRRTLSPDRTSGAEAVRVVSAYPAASEEGEDGASLAEAAALPPDGGAGGSRAFAPENMLPQPAPPPVKPYLFPPLSMLQPGGGKGGGSQKELKETALHLQQILNTFGVGAAVTNVSRGPSVTRYELTPEQGVKVSKIVSLADDIKLNLAATDIRMEAPIPGKAAIGIEVPNKENTTVALRDLISSKEFRDFPSNLAFAVGKDIGGKVVVADIAKMPHMLIAGATGSGKSVCINTLIMSLLYKAHPDEVKLIMIDPKVVELRVYNGIPHLLIPVVTDPKKAAAALHWGVSEMTERYKLFADYNVRDLKGFQKKTESMRENGREDAPAPMPQIVIIVDELADLMMVAPGEVEESVCRLAQLARAAGIHLIIATQRPSVDVITGLIKANMPSRAAFAVSSGVDSRTILDMNGAEKLLGKGDMLFYPQGYSKPARVQGAFVSDKEVSDVVDFLKGQTPGSVYARDVEERIRKIGGTDQEDASGNGEEKDEYFAEAGRFLIDKDKASIGMLQRVFKIGFNRAARIMDQLCAYGVVGEEEGTKPRKVLMSQAEFEQLLEEI